jgi:hypothetical protein
MERRVIVPLLLGLLVIAVAFFGLYSTGTMEKDQSLSCDRTDLVGAFVKNSRGDVIGVVSRVEDFGDQSFAIINHGSEFSYGEGGRYTPVPVGALKIPEARMDQSARMKTVVLNRTERALEAAPYWDPTKMDDPTYEARIAGFFGVQPVLCG